MGKNFAQMFIMLCHLYQLGFCIIFELSFTVDFTIKLTSNITEFENNKTTHLTGNTVNL